MDTLIDRNNSRYKVVETAIMRAAGNALDGPNHHQGKDNFFDSGGDSLGAIVFIEQVKKSTGVEVPFTMLISDTFADIAIFVNQSDSLRLMIKVKGILS